MRLMAALCNGAVRRQPVDSHVIICHTSVTCETSLLSLYIYHISVEQTRGQRQTGRNDLPDKGEKVA